MLQFMLRKADVEKLDGGLSFFEDIAFDEFGVYVSKVEDVADDMQLFTVAASVDDVLALTKYVTSR